MQLPDDLKDLPLITDYRGLRAAIAARRKELGLTQNDLDYLAYLADGHVGKLECGTKRYGDISLTATLAALRVALLLVPVEDGHTEKNARGMQMLPTRPGQ
jgi:hypothetical protein